MLFNWYLDDAFLNGNVPVRDEFAAYCLSSNKIYKALSQPIIESTPESRIGGGIFNDMTHYIAFRSEVGTLKPLLQDVVPWHKLMLAVEIERDLPDYPPIPHSDKPADSLLIAAMVLDFDEPWANGSWMPVNKTILHCSSSNSTVPSDNDLKAVSEGQYYKLAVWTLHGLLCIRHGPRGFYFDLIPHIPSEAKEYPPRRITVPARPRRHSLCGYLGEKCRDKIIQERRLAGWQGIDRQANCGWGGGGSVRSENDFSF